MSSKVFLNNIQLNSLHFQVILYQHHYVYFDMYVVCVCLGILGYSIAVLYMPVPSERSEI